MQEMRVWSLDQENPLDKGMATHSNILAWRLPWPEEPGGLQFTGRVGHNGSDLTPHTCTPPFCRWDWGRQGLTHLSKVTRLWVMEWEMSEGSVKPQVDAEPSSTGSTLDLESWTRCFWTFVRQRTEVQLMLPKVEKNLTIYWEINCIFRFAGE